jgi:hypothetical protein
MRSMVSFWKCCDRIWIVSSTSTLVNSEVTSKLTKMSVSCSLISVSDFLMWCFDCPTDSLNCVGRYFVKLCVGDKMQLTIGLSGLPSLWMLGKPYIRAGTAACGISFLLHLPGGMAS